MIAAIFTKSHARPALHMALSLATCACLFTPAHAQQSPAAEMAGQWEARTPDGKRKCPVQLRNEPAGGGLALGVTAACRKTFPDLAGAAAWTAPQAGRVDIIDKAGAPLLSFNKGDGALSARTSRADIVELARPGAPLAPKPATAAAAPRTETAAASQTATIVPAVNLPPVRATDIPGRYAILRDLTRDTGCMLTLEASARAILAPACRDNGISIFEPQRWALADGKLALTARKGHRAHFIRTQDGSWQKDPKEGGKPLGFRKM